MEREWREEFDKTQLQGAQAKAAAAEPLRLGMFSCVEELEALGGERLRQGLTALGLKSGGTVRERAEVRGSHTNYARVLFRLVAAPVAGAGQAPGGLPEEAEGEGSLGGAPCSIGRRSYRATHR